MGVSDFWCVLLYLSGSEQAGRAIRAGPLNMLPCVHVRSIEVVVYHSPDRETLF